MCCMCQTQYIFYSLNPQSKDHLKLLPSPLHRMGNSGWKEMTSPICLTGKYQEYNSPFWFSASSSTPIHLSRGMQKEILKGLCKLCKGTITLYYRSKFTSAFASFSLPQSHPCPPEWEPEWQRARLLQGQKRFERSFHPFPCAQAE